MVYVNSCVIQFEGKFTKAFHSSVVRKGPESAVIAALDAGTIKVDKKQANLQIRLCDGRRSDELPLDTV